MALEEQNDTRKKNDHNVTFTNEALSVPAACEETGGRLKVMLFTSPPAPANSLWCICTDRRSFLVGSHP